MKWITVDENLTAKELRAITARPEENFAGVEAIVDEILQAIRQDGDKALRAYTKKLDKCDLADFRVSPEEIAAAKAEVGEEMLNILQEAANNIYRYHQEQVSNSWLKEFAPDIKLGMRITPIQRVGLYVPGGTAAYPSTVLMDAIPAKVAGVPSLVMISPPNPEGKINPIILAAASIAGVDEIYKIGGAQGVGALAYGTESIEPVNKIVGPGNAFVATAKRKVFGTVGIDMIAGPSEVGIIADDSANPEWVAADLLAQAEHDARAAVYLVTPSKALGEAVATAVRAQIAQAPRKEIMEASVNNWMQIFLVKDLEQGFTVMNGIAPEHLELAIENPENYLDKVQNAGAIFMGHFTPEPIGDYFAGPNHTLPTSGTAKFSSPLGVYDYIKRSSVLWYGESAFRAAAPKVEKFAKTEGLFGHAASISQRSKTN